MSIDLAGLLSPLTQVAKQGQARREVDLSKFVSTVLTATQKAAAATDQAAALADFRKRIGEVADLLSKVEEVDGKYWAPELKAYDEYGKPKDEDEEGMTGKGAPPATSAEAQKTDGEDTKTIDGVAFPKQAFAYSPDGPAQWKLPLYDAPADVAADKPSPTLTSAAAQALSPSGFRGQKADIPEADVPAVRKAVRNAWLKAHPDKTSADLPDSISKSEDGPAWPKDMSPDEPPIYRPERMTKGEVPIPARTGAEDFHRRQREKKARAIERRQNPSGRATR